MLEQTNPETITNLHTDLANRFMYMFFCLKACTDRFLSSIRPVIATDTTFLKGPHAGVLFVAVCMDGNDQIFPLAFGVGDSETNEAWEWFLTRLYRAVGEVNDLVIVSDRKNSIITGVEKVFPKSFQGACVVHLEQNMLGRYGKNKKLKDIFRKAVKVYRVNQFTRCMEQLANINSEAAMYITDVGFERWARAYSPRKRYNLTSSNIAEAMNNAIKVCRELPITGVIDCIRGVLQRWFYDHRTSAGKLKSTLTTKTDVSIGVKDEKARYLMVYPITYYSFLVKDGDFDRTVDLTSKTSYSGEIHPVGHPPEWLVPEDIASIVVIPHVGRHLPGRPKKNRIPSFGEGVSQSRCTTCHRNGHNSHSCTYSRSSRPLTSTSGVVEGSGSHNV
ncbi:hypothetical protein Ddye_011074 [Dipteronia dyeriana]|uniref:MULE transposase domain-containing protein n=1 Tax=Dipteronia dyeriana TaxID=168575 RepID=A0AAD9XEX8_9ROSI|nr:hypothetical protein Ddye_011074 [Dipteronia dyeriana]